MWLWVAIGSAAFAVGYDFSVSLRHLKFLGPEGELNPFIRRAIERFGLLHGLLVAHALPNLAFLGLLLGLQAERLALFWAGVKLGFLALQLLRHEIFR